MARHGAILVALLIMLGGCSGLPEARVPLSAPGSEPYDQRILGSWFTGQQETDKFYLHLKARSEPNMLDGTGILMDLGNGDFTPPDAADIAWSTAIVHASRLDGSTYYNIKRLVGIGDDYGAAEDRKGYIIIRADLKDDRTLNLCVMDISSVEDAIERGEVKGTSVDGNEGKNIKLDYMFLDVSKAELVKFIRQNRNGELFGACILFYKVT